MRGIDRRRRLFAWVAAGCVGLSAASVAPAHEGHDHGPATKPAADEARLVRVAGEMAAAADALWGALTEEQRAAAKFEFNADERLNWHFIPKPRKGLTYKAMTPAQRHLAQALLATGMGQRGYVKATTIMSLEEILREMEKERNPPGPVRDPELYFWSVFGTPGAMGTWGWRVEGHHLSLNFTVVGGKGIVGAPNFMGTNPGEVRQGPRKGTRVLGAEEEMGRALVKALTDEQRKVAIFSADAPKDIITGADRQVKLDKFTGIAVKDLTPPQRQMLIEIVAEYAHRLRDEIADHDMARIDKAGWDKVYFAWAGGLERGQPHYYRVHGPTFLIEYDNVQNDANHVHAVWRDLENDFGGDLLRRHYEQHKGNAAHGHDK